VRGRGVREGGTLVLGRGALAVPALLEQAGERDRLLEPRPPFRRQRGPRGRRASLALDQQPPGSTHDRRATAAAALDGVHQQAVGVAQVERVGRGVAAHQPVGGASAALHHAVARERIDRVLRAARREAAVQVAHGRQVALVDTNRIARRVVAGRGFARERGQRMSSGCRQRSARAAARRVSYEPPRAA
jgi:hypothetical protein